MDIEAAARAKAGSRKDFIKTEQLEIYPDTTNQCTMIIFGMMHTVNILL